MLYATVGSRELRMLIAHASAGGGQKYKKCAENGIN